MILILDYLSNNGVQKYTMTNKVKESSEYDNCMDIAKRIDEYGLSLDKFIDDDETTLVDQTKAKKKSDCFKEIYVHFRNGDDLIDYSRRESSLSFFDCQIS
jgi:hypothetical protein